MDCYELGERLREVCIPYGCISEWSELVASSDTFLRKKLLAAMEGSSEYRNDVIAVCVSEGPDEHRPIYGVGGHITNKAEYYIHFVLALTDTAIRTKEAEYGYPAKRKHIVRALRHSFRCSVDDLSVPMDEALISLAKANLVAHAVRNITAQEGTQCLMENYAALEPYLENIIESQDMSQARLSDLLEIKPVVALIDGML